MEIDFLNPRSIALFICLLQGALFMAMLLIRGRKTGSRADAWLAAILLIMCSGLITAFVGFAHVYNAYQGLTYFPFELVFALAPAIYLYVLNLTNSERPFSSRDLIHFLPAVIYVIYRLILFSQDLGFKDWYDDNVQVPIISPVQNTLLFLWNAAYLYLSIRRYYDYRAWLNENYSNTAQITFGWLRNFLFLFVFLILLSTGFELTNSFIFKLSYSQMFYYEVTLALLVYYLALAGYLKTAGIKPVYEPVDYVDSADLDVSKAEPQTSSRIRKTTIAADELPVLKQRLSEAMRSKKLYLEPDLSLSDLAREMGINTSALSYLINTGFGRNFNDFVNEYRIEEFKRRVQTRKEDSSLLAVALDCGFNSKATFNRVFKKFTGLSPREFENLAAAGSQIK